MAEPNFKNRTLFHGDNLPFLRALNSESVHLIATDPPFNKGRDFHATPDSLAAGAKFQDRWSWANDVEGEWVDQITDDWPNVMNVINGSRQSYGDDMGAFLCFMAVRLLEIHRILRPDGSIYLHCDPTASHYLKELMDAIFGKQNFRNEIIWAYGQSARGAKAIASQFARNHDVILFYSKSSKVVFNRVTVVERHPIGRLPSHIRIDDSGAFKTSPRGDYTDESVRRLESEGRIHRTATGKIRIKYPLAIEKGFVLEPRRVGSTWTDIPDMMHAPKSERTGYPTQKPLALYERMIEASSNPGDIVMDPFAGCATTPIAAERLRRKWIGIDIWDKAHAEVERRIENNRQLLTDPDPQVHYETKPPERTDGGEKAVPFLQVTERYKEPAGPKITRAEMFEHLIAQHGQRCQGCNRSFDDPRYLQLDHNTPRADGGLNHITNRVLLCGPCNMLKSHRFTLSGLREQNRKLGYMAKQ